MNRLLPNWPLKVMALLLSIALWSHVRGELNPLETATFSVHLDPKVPIHLQLQTREVPSSVRVTVRGPHQELRALGGVTLPLPNPLSPSDTEAPFVANNGLSATLDFSSVSRASGAAQVVPVRVEAQNPEVEVLGVKPANVSVVLKQTKAKP